MEQERFAALQRQQKQAEAERHRRTTAVQDAMGLLQYTYDIAQRHASSRQIYQNPTAVAQIRHEFDVQKKSIKVDLKKCTTFIKKIKMGTYWNPATTGGAANVTTAQQQQQQQSMLLLIHKMMDTITNDVASLNLSRYVEEVVAAILESCSILPTTSGNTIATTSTGTNTTSTSSSSSSSSSSNTNKMSSLELSVLVALIQAMHARYPDFLSNLLPPLWNALLLDTTTTTKQHRRWYVRLFTELLLHGLLSPNDTTKLVKYITEGGKDAAPDAVAMVALIRTAGWQVLGIVPTSLQNAIRTIEQEHSLRRQQQPEQQPEPEPTNDNEREGDAPKDVPGGTDQASKSPSVDTAPIVLDADLLDQALTFVQRLQPVLKEQRAVPAATSESLVQHYLTAYRLMSTSYRQTHLKMKKLEKRCAEDRLIAGQLTAQREKGYTDAQKLCDTLQKSVEVLSDGLNEPMPVIVQDDDDNDGDRTLNTGAGIEVWTKDSNEANKENLGPFDDEETRSFYCDIPDLLATIPPALLGLSEEQVEKQKLWNQQKYAVGGTISTTTTTAADDEAVTPTSVEQLEAAEQGVTLDDDDLESQKPEGGTCRAMDGTCPF